MNIESLKLSGIKYRINFKDSIDLNGDDCQGMFSPMKNEIFIKEDLRSDLQSVLSVLIHEMIHAIDYCYDVGLTETKVQKLGMGVHDLLVNNPQLLEAIRESA